MKTIENVSNDSIKQNRDYVKKYNLFVLKFSTSSPSELSFSNQLNNFPLSRREIFDLYFHEYIPRINDLYSFSSRILLYLSRSFFSPFNKLIKFRRYSANLDYLKRVYPCLSDKIIFGRVCVIFDYYELIYVFFAKEVCNAD